MSRDDKAGDLKVLDERLAANDLWSLILFSPCDHYLHHVNERPTQIELTDVIGHGLETFLRAYSCPLEDDLKVLFGHISEKQKELS